MKSGTVSDWVCLSTRCSDLSTGVCVEWAQCKARAARWLEETILLAEEMQSPLLPQVAQTMVA